MWLAVFTSVITVGVYQVARCGYAVYTFVITVGVYQVARCG